MNFAFPKNFDRKFQGENFKISLLKLQDFSPRFAVKPPLIFNLLIINMLQNTPIFHDFVKYFYQF